MEQVHLMGDFGEDFSPNFQVEDEIKEKETCDLEDIKLEEKDPAALLFEVKGDKDVEKNALTFDQKLALAENDPDEVRRLLLMKYLEEDIVNDDIVLIGLLMVVAFFVAELFLAA